MLAEEQTMWRITYKKGEELVQNMYDDGCSSLCHCTLSEILGSGIRSAPKIFSIIFNDIEFCYEMTGQCDKHGTLHSGFPDPDGGHPPILVHGLELTSQQKHKVTFIDKESEDIAQTEEITGPPLSNHSTLHSAQDQRRSKPHREKETDRDSRPIGQANVTANTSENLRSKSQHLGDAMEKSNSLGKMTKTANRDGTESRAKEQVAEIHNAKRWRKMDTLDEKQTTR
jgi:hypothetical protein